MRITDRMTTNNYMLKLSKSQGDLNMMNERVTSGRRYAKASEDPGSALKAYKAKEGLSRNELYQNNLKEVKSINNETEDLVSQINKVLTDVYEQILQGKTGTNESARGITAEALRNYQSEIYEIANTRSNGKYIFGGQQATVMPFEISGGALLYHGTDVDTGTFGAEPVYFDIGLGLRTDAGGNVVAGTALDIATPGSTYFGTGTTTVNGLPISNNLYNLIGQIADAFENNDMSHMDDFMKALDTRTDDNMVNYTNIGQRSNFIDFLQSRFETQEDSVTARLQTLEKIDPAQAILEYKTQEVAYNAALNMGSKILQMSLLDYMR